VFFLRQTAKKLGGSTRNGSTIATAGLELQNCRGQFRAPSIAGPVSELPPGSRLVIKTCFFCGGPQKKLGGSSRNLSARNLYIRQGLFRASCPGNFITKNTLPRAFIWASNCDRRVRAAELPRAIPRPGNCRACV
jgi:hypothetical protein